jgi:hypothetical protein
MADEHGYIGRRTSDRVRHTAVAELPRRTELVDRRRRHPEHRRHLPHRQQPLQPRRRTPVPGYQGDTKRPENAGETRRPAGLPPGPAASVSASLRIPTTSTQRDFTDCHAGGQGFKSPTPRQ